MKKVINNPSNVVEEMVSGFVRAHGDLVTRKEGSHVILKKDKEPGKVALISGGGSGHEPSHAGFVGKGMLSAAVCGQVFTSPTPDQVYDAIVSADQGVGALLIIKNYSGDVMNFDMARDMAEMEDIAVGTVLVDDDIAVEDSTHTQGRRGVAGTVLVHKILGAAAAEGKSIAELEALGKEVVAHTKTIGVALSGCTVPEIGNPGFTLADDELEFGVGIHGEPGYKREKMKSSKEMAEEIVGQLKKAFDWTAGDKFVVFVNGLGSTPLMEQYVFMNDCLNLLEADKLDIAYTKVGNYMTAIEMNGVSLTMLQVKEDKWLDYLHKDVQTVAWK